MLSATPPPKALLLAGAAAAVAALVYLRRWPDPWPEAFGHHEVWHLLVLGGATLHYFYVLGLVSAPAIL